MLFERKKSARFNSVVVPVWMQTVAPSSSLAEATPSDFGKNGGSPSHPQLLDWLAQRFMDDGWSLNLSNEIYLDHEGVSWEGRGIPPTLALDVFPAANPDGGHAQALQDLLTRIAADLSSAEAPH